MRLGKPSSIAKIPSKERGPAAETTRRTVVERKGGKGSLTERLHRGTQASIMMRRRQDGRFYQTGGSDAFLNDNREYTPSAQLGKRAHGEV